MPDDPDPAAHGVGGLDDAGADGVDGGARAAQPGRAGDGGDLVPVPLEATRQRQQDGLGGRHPADQHHRPAVRAFPGVAVVVHVVEQRHHRAPGPLQDGRDRLLPAHLCHRSTSCPSRGGCTVNRSRWLPARARGRTRACGRPEGRGHLPGS
ncbi:hypothetical protein GCM10023203_55900 [Actinomycetospora straminea]|uniref:Uncharacterized protein n=1 Tax=Actinomycetospora straminea TaxID=663607 RepID=A0ABP9F581_9PSEU